LFIKVIKKHGYLEREKFSFEELKPDEGENFEIPETHVDEIEIEQERNDKNAQEKIDIDEIIRRIKDEYEAKIAEAYRRGFEDAEKVLRKKMNDELNQQISHFDRLIKSFSGEIEALGQKIESVVISLAIEIAKKIVKREIEKDDEFIINQVREAIKRVIGVERIRIRVNPEDEKLVKELKPELLQIADSARDIVVEPDPGVERGGCIIESELGNVDARISTQFSLIENSLLETFNQQ